MLLAVPQLILHGKTGKMGNKDARSGLFRTGDRAHNADHSRIVSKAIYSKKRADCNMKFDHSYWLTYNY